jgi:hypothetical protein
VAAAQNFATNGYHGGGAVPAGTSASSGGGTMSTDGYSAPHMSAADEQKALISGVGELGPLLTSVPELKKLLDHAVATGQSAQDFQNAVTNSKWYRSNSDTARQQAVLAISDPTTYRNNFLAKQGSIQSIANAMGVGLNSTQLGVITHEALYGGMDDTAIQKKVASQFNIKAGPKNLGGQAAQVFNQLKQSAADYGQQISDPTAMFRTQQVLGQGSTVDHYTENFKQLAKAMYPSLAGQIDNGLTIKDIAAPYIQTKANILEQDPSTINWTTDPAIKKALQGSVDATGKPSGISPMYQFEQQLRSDPKWQYTKNAQDAMSSTLLKLGQDFGFAS